MKFTEFLNEANASAAAIAEIESIELLAEDDGFELIVYFNNQDIKEHEAEHIAGIFDFPNDADQYFLKPELPKDRAAYQVSVDEDGYKYYDKAKALAKKYKITIEDDSDDRNK